MSRRSILILVAVIAFVVIGGYWVATGLLKTQVEQALGPESTTESITVGLTGVTITGLHIKAPPGWPSAETLSAERVTVTPSLLAALTGRVRVNSIRVEKPYLSVLRTRDEKLRLLPSFLEGKPAATPGEKSDEPSSASEMSIDSIKMSDGVVEFFDASVRRPPHKIRLEQIDLEIEDVVVPSLVGRTDIDFSGVVKGVKQDGRIEVDGWAEIASRDSSIETRIKSVDLLALQPYLIKASESGVKRGTLDLDVKSEVRNKRLNAPGKLVLSNLELASSGGLGTFMGVPRNAVLFFMKDKNDRIDIDFALNGNIDNPSFSLNEAFATQVASAMAGTLGVSITGIAEAFGSVGGTGVEAIGGVFKGLGDALKPSETKK